MSTPDVLAFADKKTDGAFAVTEPSGTTVAWIKVSSWTGAKFTATTASGEPLCAGRSSFWGTTWFAEDPAGRALCSLKNNLWGTKKEVTLADERVLTLHGKMFSRDWALVDRDEKPILSSTPFVSSWSFHPDAWLVRSHDATLDLAQVIGIVQLNRLMIKAGRTAAAAT